MAEIGNTPPLPPPVPAEQRAASQEYRYQAEGRQVRLSVQGKLDATGTAPRFGAGAWLAMSVEENGRRSELQWTEQGCVITISSTRRACSAEEKDRTLRWLRQIPKQPAPPA
ncbi:hypothetical protein CR207_03525 [Chromobacterium violaceum]|uniref:Uncharacterized protein n=1 Tax=Chromobacterium violaceum TaxID=536 RepID=A0A202BGC7_CHRVL|nr:hypothetical protein [Chromobacterium violaceum]ATP27547.1 hypothetical protein CRN81_03510 [Chromobacterium violaceum]ATP31462.1 hypothetical protein CR207_03525 [Chromobacterium violaceum]MCD0494942.1 hypothetical protein [Chromobacterium violaceum]OVE50518.1 hypothetical protein CBW21_00560 [Chromobacterium violaceum]